MKYILLYICITAVLLTTASCSSDDDIPVVPETSQATGDNQGDIQPVSWRATAKTPEELQEMEAVISAVRGAGYTYRDNASYCVGTDMEVFNMRRLREMENKDGE